jgi:hypothetical protein
MINTLVYYFHKTKLLIKVKIHSHEWKTVTLYIYAILINNIHNEMFRDFHFTSWNITAFISILYILSMLFTRFYVASDQLSMYINLLFLFFPLPRVWQVNLYMYVIFTTFAIVIMFRLIPVDELNSNKIHVRPVIYYFMYLRVYDIFVLFGILHLYFDYYKSHLPEIRAIEHIRTILRKDIETEEDVPLVTV